MTRRIRVAGVPADFRVPPGWPTPTDRWIRTNAFWVPPVDWTPLPGLKPAPRSWTYWSPNPLWRKTRSAAYRAHRIFARVTGILLLVVLAAGWAARAADAPAPALVSLAIVGLTLALAGLIGYLATYTFATDRALAHHALLAAEGRTQRLTREYQRYLLDVA
jgi:hypothetical protein